MENFAQVLRLNLDTLSIMGHTVCIDELAAADMYYTDDAARNCDFKLLVKKDDIVIAIVYMYPDGRFFGAEDTLRKPISVWIEKTRKNLNK